jgi:hypothetical protein
MRVSVAGDGAYAMAEGGIGTARVEDGGGNGTNSETYVGV